MPVSSKHKVLVFLLFMGLYGVFYVFPNFVSLIPPIELPLLAIDRATPFLPWTFFIYISDYALVLYAVARIKDRDAFRVLCRNCFGVLFLCGFIFMAFPTIYPRPEYLPTSSGILNYLMYLVSVGDMPTNCFPSMHVALTAVAAWNLRFLKPGWFALFILWSLSIFVSTMTTKQHYFADILGGLAAAGAVVAVELAFRARHRVLRRVG